MATARLIDGKKIAADYLSSAASEIKELIAQGCDLTLATVQVGQAKDAALYSKHIGQLLKRMGIGWNPCVFSDDESEKIILDKIEALNRDPQITGILVFAPLPARLDPSRILDHVTPSKDVEGRTFLKRLTGKRGHSGVLSPTANAALMLIESVKFDITGKDAVVVGRSDLIGKAVAVLLMDKHATVTVCHSKTKNLKRHIQNAEIVVAAAGKPGLIKGQWLKSGSIVVDVGENVVDGKIVGDVDFESAKKKAVFLSPVPGGVGPVTNVMLVKNLIRLAKASEK